ncbi:hypothetical protein [Nakamurella sp.]|uniref:hypothetical protein n=1 Tax=Nakamurella sp. TaxID=1869182 RepID=UPI003784AF3E
MTDPDDEVLTRLTRLATAMRVEPPADGLVDDVLARIDKMTVPVRSGPRQHLARWADSARRHRRAATALAVALILTLLAVSPAGAKIAEWLGIGAVQIVPVPAPPGDAATADPADADGFTEVTLEQARAQAPFPLIVPADLGPPARVLLGPGRTVVSMVWPAGDPAAPGPPVRLDQLAGRPDYAVVKKYADDIDFTQVGGADAFWLRMPHPLVYTDPTGAEQTQRSRIAGPTLIWTDGPVTLRLEGVPGRDRAMQIARSAG